MPRHKRQEETAADHDSFLDIVANIVGILIILVVLVGVRAKHAPVAVSIPAPADEAKKADAGEDLKIVSRIHDDILEMNRQGIRLAKEAILRDRQRNELAVRVAAIERKNKDERNRLDGHARAEYDLQRRLADQQAKLSDAMRKSILARQKKSDAKPIELEHHPTPISHTVHGREIHIQLRDGRAVVVPFDKLVEHFKGELQRKAYRLQHQRELTDKLGPIDGFRLRYTIERIDATPELYMQTGRASSVIRLRLVEFLPVNRYLGETLDAALADGSQLRQTLARHRPGLATVTIWTYPDSFADYQRLKTMIYQLGFSVAARPLSFGTPISASPQGSRSAAQ